MKKSSVLLLKLGFLFVCIDIGPINDMFNDGLGYLLIFFCLLMLKDKSIPWFIALILSFFLAPTAFIIQSMAYFGSPSWELVFIRCVPPLIAIPLGIIIAFIIGPLTKKGKSGVKQACLFYFFAQVIDIACIVYFIPIRTSMLFDNFNTNSLVIIVSGALYMFSLLMYLSFFSFTKLVPKKH